MNSGRRMHTIDIPLGIKSSTAAIRKTPGIRPRRALIHVCVCVRILYVWEPRGVRFSVALAEQSPPRIYIRSGNTCCAVRMKGKRTRGKCTFEGFGRSAVAVCLPCDAKSLPDGIYIREVVQSI